MEVYVRHCSSPIGVLRISGTEDGVTGVGFLEGWDEHRACLRKSSRVPSVLVECMEQLQEYFEGRRREFTALRMLPIGTEFQRRVWKELCRLPWGEGITYRELSNRLRSPLAAQAVGGAIARNPLALIIPCHRVTPTRGRTGEYAWGSWRKKWLLRYEGITVASESPGTSCRQCRFSPS